MNPEDPFSAIGGERTIIKPRLGRPGTASVDSLDDILGPTPGTFHSNGSAPDKPSHDGIEHLLQHYRESTATNRNALLEKSSPLLRLMISVCQMGSLPSLPAFSSMLHTGLDELDNELSRQQRTQAEKLSVRYMLCTCLDEMAANTPWGGSGQWAAHSLLLQIFGETWGGEKIFALTQKMIQNPADNRDLLELMAVLLSLGFKGKYKVEQGGELALVQLKTRLFQLVQQSSVNNPLPLHPEFWKSRAPADRKPFLRVPVWLPISAMCAIGTVFFLGLYFNMNTQSDQAFAEISSISFPPPEFPQTQAAPVSTSVGLELPAQLQQEIIQGQLTLKQIGNKSIVILVGDGLFDSGSAELTAKAMPLVDKVARELALHPGRITVTGYTDNQPIRSIRFPSNWQLSAERAEHVGQRIAAFLPNTAIATEGAGAANPIAPNDSARNRALNRRVEITLIHSR